MKYLFDKSKSFAALFACIVCTLFFCIGCASRTEKIVSTELTIQRGTNTAHLVSPKDVSFKSFTLRPDGSVELTEYRSVGNEAAIKSSEAQAAMYQNTFNRALTLGKEAAEAGLRGVGIPIPYNQPAPAAPAQALPAIVNPLQPAADPAVKKPQAQAKPTQEQLDAAARIAELLVNSGPK